MCIHCLVNATITFRSRDHYAYLIEKIRLSMDIYLQKLFLLRMKARFQTYFFLTHAFLLDRVAFYRNYLGHPINHCKIPYLVFFMRMYWNKKWWTQNSYNLFQKFPDAVQKPTQHYKGPWHVLLGGLPTLIQNSSHPAVTIVLYLPCIWMKKLLKIF